MQVQAVAAARLDEVNKRFNDMARLKQRMEHAVASWSEVPDRALTGDMICHLIETFPE